MTMRNEAARLFFAVSALILVGMLSAPTGGNLGRTPEEISPSKLISSPERKSQLKEKMTVKIAERKATRKLVAKKS